MMISVFMISIACFIIIKYHLLFHTDLSKLLTRCEAEDHYAAFPFVSQLVFQIKKGKSDFEIGRIPFAFASFLIL